MASKSEPVGIGSTARTTSAFKGRLSKFGLLATSAWLVVGVLVMVFVADHSQPVKPNEWGDMFAGLFAPVAFLWLVLGFFQQGQELQLSTHALRLQAEELKHSVEQQRELVEVTRQQVLANLDEQERKRAAETEAAQPRFVFSSTGWSSANSGAMAYGVDLRNDGATVNAVQLSFDPAFKLKTQQYIPSIRRDETVKLVWTFPDGFPDAGISIVAVFLDWQQKEGTHHFRARFVHTPDGKHFEAFRTIA
jgi:hypothetical protein